eukprot:CAMPEP_0195300458 /NCGR_PEP_ID=MMETSP0707-20130614/27451_1 /TAXON_ID=33640 /ORGANISM="Asterionellopsis glacialis, Strain CCMP134" /LENGTH=451 /DNA_ID=CAMNT_0040363145 /DNA_START=30 /DNA_END=1382 /DNA_ORIENTATION=+
MSESQGSPQAGPRRAFFIPATPAQLTSTTQSSHRTSPEIQAQQAHYHPMSNSQQAAMVRSGPHFSGAKRVRSNSEHEQEEISNVRIQELQLRHLDWSSKQGRILTANGKASEYYQRCSFDSSELPHYHLQMGNTHPAFIRWSEQEEHNFLVCGAWTRPLFVGGWEHSTSIDERCYNVQTPTLFIDLRIPTTREAVLPLHCTSLSSLDDTSLRMYARQHVFAGYTKINWEGVPSPQRSVATIASASSRDTSKSKSSSVSASSVTVKQKQRAVCTRHHCIDWNFVGVPRPVPNKWWVEMSDDEQMWKEWAYPTDDNGQHYYCERWERLGDGDSDDVALALRKNPNDGPDGILVVVGDHFNYCFGRRMTGDENHYPTVSTLVNLVDQALAVGDRITAESYLSIDAGHGSVSKGWLIDCAIQPWKEGTFLNTTEDIIIEGEDMETCKVLWKGQVW